MCESMCVSVSRSGGLVARWRVDAMCHLHTLLGLVSHPVRYGFDTFLRAALLKLCTRCKSTGLGLGLTEWVGWTTPQPGAAGAGGPGTLQQSAEAPPSTPDDRGARGAWEASREASHTAATRSLPRQSGTGPARPWPRLAPLSRASLLQATLGLGGWRQAKAGSTHVPAVGGV